MKKVDPGLELSEFNSNILVFGGPYSNYQATEAIMRVANRQGISPDNVICTGDIVAYCGEPEETVNLIRNWGCHVIMGNCEESLGFDKLDCGCGFEIGSVCETLSVDWYNHAMNQVSDDNKQWMRALPRRIRFQINALNFSVIHGGIEDMSEFIFSSTDESRKISHLKTLDADCIIGGHCGLPFGQKVDNNYWLNAGVIGMPANDGTNKGWYMLLTVESKRIVATWHNLEYDNQGAVESMVRNALPDPYRHTLMNGLWPSMSVLPEYEKSLQGKELNPYPVSIQSAPQ